MENILKNNEDLDEFLYSIYNFEKSKFLMLDSSVSGILKAIASTERVYNVIAECMVNFDFISKWNEAARETELVLPEDDADKIAFIFCVLSNLDDKNLNASALLQHYYSGESGVTAYEQFSKLVVCKFRDLILDRLGVSLNEEAEEGEQTDSIAETYQKLYDSVRLLKDQVENSNKLKSFGLKKDELISVISAFEQAVKDNREEYFYAFTVTIISSTRKIKTLKKLVLEISSYVAAILKM